MVECQGLYRGYEYAVVMNDMGYRCGYVLIPPGHPWEGVHYDNIPASCHGGLTFSGPRRQDHRYWIGFDCAHAGDNPDPDAVPKQLREMYNKQVCINLGIEEECDVINKPGVRSIAYVIIECKNLIDQAHEADPKNG